LAENGGDAVFGSAPAPQVRESEWSLLLLENLLALIVSEISTWTWLDQLGY